MARRKRQGEIDCFHDQVIVIGHQAIRVAEPVESSDGLRQHFKKAFPVLIVEEDLLSGVSARGDVVQRAWVFDPQRSSHELSLSTLVLNCKPNPICILVRNN